MASFSRRAFLNQMANVSALALLPAFDAEASGQAGRTENPKTVTFELKFTGPLGFIPKDDYIWVYAPYTTFEHYPVASADSGELLLDDANDYVLSGILPTANATTTHFAPLARSVHNPFDNAKKNCRIGIKVPRPDLVRGINLVKLKVDGTTQSLPTGLRFIYNNIASTSKPALGNATSSFTPEFQDYDPIWELNIRVVPEAVIDRCHKAAKTSFTEVAKLCSVSTIPLLDYGDPAHCHGLSKKLVHPFRGPGSDCQTLSMWINAT